MPSRIIAARAVSAICRNSAMRKSANQRGAEAAASEMPVLVLPAGPKAHVSAARTSSMR